MNERIQKALEIAHDGAIDGGHHKMWVIDQMVRALTGCPMVTMQNHHAHCPINGFKTIEFEGQGESEEYQEWVADHCNGEDGPHTYEWDTGIAP